MTTRPERPGGPVPASIRFAFSAIWLVALLAAGSASASTGDPVDEEVRLPSPVEGVVLACTWTTPEANDEESPPPWPAAALLTVAGPNDRHQSVGPHRLFEDLAHGLARRGIASLRCDDPGVGGSGGDWVQWSYDLRAADALAMVRWMADRPRIRGDAVGLIGNSEGGAVGPLAAASAPDEVAFLVLLAGPGLPARESLAINLETSIDRLGVQESAAERLREQFDRLVGIVSRDPSVPETKQAMRSFLADGGGLLIPPYPFVPREPEALADFLLSPWYRSQFDYRPEQTLASVAEAGIPVLALAGSRDPVLPASDHLPAIRSALAGHPQAEVRELEHLNHVFQAAGTGSPAEYPSLEAGFAPEAITVVADFVRSAIGEPRPGAAER